MHSPLSSERKWPSRTPRGYDRDSGGFVLVAVLLLIALATVLIVTTSGVSQIERKAVSNSAKQQIAKQNALFALQIALGQLQSAAGPDQRVTATADILNSNSVANSPVAQPYWTGVWKTCNTNYSPSPWFRPQPLDVDVNGNLGTTTTALRPWSTGGGAANTNMVWLVSGATNNALINPLTTSSNNWVSNSVLLASNWGTNQMAVIVPAVTLSYANTNSGRYAYWVSDEGVKAKVSLADTNMTTNTSLAPVTLKVASILHGMATAVPNASKVITNYGISSVLTSDFRSNTNLSKLTGISGLALITNGIPTFTNNTLAADLTVWSFGVLSDTRNGGLKQDLTAAFESTGSGNTNYNLLTIRSGSGAGNDSVCVYRAQNLAIPAIITTIGSASTNGGTAVYDGLRWQSLYSYYNLYKAVMPLSPPTTSVNTNALIQKGIGILPTTNVPSTMTVRVPFYGEPATGSTNIISYLNPALIADRLDCSITNVSTKYTVGSNTVTSYTFAVNYYPMIVIMNPFPVYLDISRTMYSLNKAPNNPTINLICGTNKITEQYYYYTVTTNVGPPVTYKTNTNGPFTMTSSNLWPSVSTNSANSNGYLAKTWGENGIYPFTQVSATNLTIMAPGEIRVLAMTNNQSATNMLIACTLSNLSGVGSSLSCGSTYVQTNWTNTITLGGSTITVLGTTNSSNDAITITPSSSSQGGYGEARFNIGFGNGGVGGFTNNVSGWPGNASSNVYGFGTVLLGCLTASPSFTAANASVAYNLHSLPSAGVRVFGVIERLKGVVSPSDPNYSWSGTSLPIFSGNSLSLNGVFPGFAGLGLSYPASTETYATYGGSAAVSYSLFQTLTGTNGQVTTSWGNNSVGYNSPDTTPTSNNNTCFVLYDIPIAPMTSLGQFLHLADKVFTGAYTVDYLPRMSIGGSFASPDLPLSSTAVLASQSGGSSTNTTLRDNSYMANEALFDTFFFSTVPPTASGFNWTNSGTLSYGTFAQTFNSITIAQRQPLPNFRYTFYFKQGNPPSPSALQNESTAAANLLIDGAFNVNSTSVAAWKALLTSLGGQSYTSYNYLTGSYVTNTPINPIPRFWSVCRSSAKDPWDGMRDLTDTQVTALAQEIVKQVRLRGPFLSLGDFLNRQLPSKSATASVINTMGALQNAIENTQTNGSSADVNSAFHGASTFAAKVTTGVVVSGFAGVPNVSSIITNSAVGMPGYLMQQDLVQAFAPVLSARSDTFVIRVYGEVQKPVATSSTAASGSSSSWNVTPANDQGQAWGEAVVQRLPDFYDQTDSSLTVNASTYGLTGINIPLGDATPLKNLSGPIVSAYNQIMGRRFKIISFRWLNPNEL